MGNCGSSDEKPKTQNQQQQGGQLFLEDLNIDLTGVDTGNNNNTVEATAVAPASGPVDLRAPEKCDDTAFLAFVNSNSATASKVTHLIIGGEYASNACILTDASIQVIIEKFPSLVDLDLMHSTAFTPSGLALLGKIAGLKSLYLTYSPVLSDEHLEQVAASLPGLTDLDISRCKNISDAGLKFVADGMTQLKRLSLERNEQIGEEGLRHVGKLTSLTELSLSDTKLSDAAVAHLAPLTNLVKLDMDSASGVTTAGFQAFIGKLVSLQELSLSYIGTVTDADLEQIGSNLTNLTILDIRKNPLITDAGIANFSKLTKLVKLFINRIPALTDTSLVDVINNLPALEKINVEDCPKISQGAIAKFKTAHPKCVVFADRPKQ